MLIFTGMVVAPCLVIAKHFIAMFPRHASVHLVTQATSVNTKSVKILLAVFVGMVCVKRH